MSKKKSRRQAEIFLPEGFERLFGSEMSAVLRKRVDRQVGRCAVSGLSLAKPHDLGLTARQVDGPIGGGTWFVTTHRRDRAQEKLVPGRTQLAPPPATYRTQLVAPLIHVDGGTESIPVLCVNPSVDHFSLDVSKTGVAVDGFQRLLREQHGWVAAGLNLGRLLDGPTEGVRVLLHSNQVVVTSGSVTWMHPLTGRAVEVFPSLLEKHGRLLVLASDRFRFREPTQFMERFPHLLEEGHVLAACVET